MTSHSTDPRASSDDCPSECQFRISIANETDSAVDEARLEAAVQRAFADADYDDVKVSIALVTDEAIHDLNRQFLAHDYPTDVLSFPLEDSPPLLEGEIVVSVDTARQGAAEVGWSWEDELLLYVVHGALHLAGYGDKSPEAAEEMRAAEADVLAQLGVQRSAADSRWTSVSGEASP
jgi:probable rRNA maturation factor